MINELINKNYHLHSLVLRSLNLYLDYLQGNHWKCTVDWSNDSPWPRHSLCMGVKIPSIDSLFLTQTGISFTFHFSHPIILNNWSAVYNIAHFQIKDVEWTICALSLTAGLSVPNDYSGEGHLSTMVRWALFWWISLLDGVERYPVIGWE